MKIKRSQLKQLIKQIIVEAIHNEMIVNKDEKPGADMFGWVNVKEDEDPYGTAVNRDYNDPRVIAHSIYQPVYLTRFSHTDEDESDVYSVYLFSSTGPRHAIKQDKTGKWFYLREHDKKWVPADEYIGAENQPKSKKSFKSGISSRLTKKIGDFIKSRGLSDINEGKFDQNKCDCGSGQPSEWEFDGQGIPLVRVCPKCREKKLSRYRPEILRGYTQADVDEPIEPEYPDDLLQEVPEKEEGVYPPVTIKMNKMGHLHIWKGNVQPKQMGKYRWEVDGNGGDLYVDVTSDVEEILNRLSPEEKEEIENGWTTVTTYFPDSYFVVDEMTGTGAVAGYQTPFAFSKKKGAGKLGSPRAIGATVGRPGHKTGFKVVKSISENGK